MTIQFSKWSQEGKEIKEVVRDRKGAWWGWEDEWDSHGKDKGNPFGPGRVRAWNRWTCARAFRELSTGCVTATEDLFHSMQEQTNDPWCQTEDEFLLVEALHLVAAAQFWGHEWEFSPCCQGHSLGWLIDSSPPNPSSFWGQTPWRAAATADPKKEMYCLPLFPLNTAA